VASRSFRVHAHACILASPGACSRRFEEVVMGMLRDKMDDELKLRGRSVHTQRAYLRCAGQFAAHHGRSPANMGEREIKAFLLYLVKEKEVSPATHRMYVASLKFLYGVTLKRPDAVVDVPFPKVPHRLPEILTGSEVERLMSCVTSIRYRTVVAVAYGAGLRMDEVRHLKPADIDSKRGVIHVRLGKGQKARDVMLGEKLLAMLREYWRVVRPAPDGWLFPSAHDPTKPVSERAIRRALKQAAKAARLKKKVYPHLLRHSFATHLLELGNDIEIIQQLLGHSSLRTTRRYARVRAEVLRRIKSPLDVVGTAEGEPLR
jgi:integrase/recombinase XerD